MWVLLSIWRAECGMPTATIVEYSSNIEIGLAPHVFFLKSLLRIGLSGRPTLCTNSHSSLHGMLCILLLCFVGFLLIWSDCLCCVKKGHNCLVSLSYRMSERLPRVNSTNLSFEITTQFPVLIHGQNVKGFLKMFSWNYSSLRKMLIKKAVYVLYYNSAICFCCNPYCRV